MSSNIVGAADPGAASLPVSEETVAGADSNGSNGHYPFDIEIFNITINITPDAEEPYWTSHRLRRPGFEEEESREASMPVKTHDQGKVEGHNAMALEFDIESADAKLYDKCIKTVSGFAPPGSEEAVDDLPVDDEVRKLILPQWKSSVITGIFRSQWSCEQESLKKAYMLGAGRQWVIRQEIGGGRNEDGTPRPPQYTLRYTFREPSEAERRKFRSSALNAQVLQLRTGGTEERRTTNLRVVCELFDALLVTVEGATIKGEPVDARNEFHKKFILANFKKNAVLRFFNTLEADLGN